MTTVDGHLVAPWDILRRIHHHLCGVLAENIWPESNHKETLKKKIKMRNILLKTKKERDYVPKKWQRKPVEMSHIKEGISFLVGCCNKSTTNWVFFLSVLEIEVPVESVSGEKSLPGSLPVVPLCPHMYVKHCVKLHNKSICMILTMMHFTYKKN